MQTIEKEQGHQQADVDPSASVIELLRVLAETLFIESISMLPEPQCRPLIKQLGRAFQ